MLDAPDTYIGAIEGDNVDIYYFDEKTKSILKGNKNVVLGLYKIIDEILVNAADQTVRNSKKCNIIKITADRETGIISVYNNGCDIPIAMHKEHKVYVPELLFGTLLTSGNYDTKDKLVGGKNGLGSKCISGDTFLILYDGKIKRADEITKKDKLIGDDGKIRNIKNIIKGRGQMYEITQGNGDSYKVNDQHILTLHMPDHKRIFWNDVKNYWSVMWWNHEEKCINKKSIVVTKKTFKCPECDIELNSSLSRHYKRQHKGIEVPKKERKSPNKEAPDTQEVKDARKELEEFCKTIIDNDTFDIEIQDYMKLNETTKKRLAGIRGQCVDWKKKDVKLDPYVLGLWLGDGDATGYRYTCHGEKDPEIIEYLKEWGKENDADINKKGKYTYSITSHENFRKKECSPLRKQLKEYNLINNKHIPLDYITNDRETRLKVLAGLIDTDGYASRNGTRIGLSQGLMHKQLIDDIVLLSRSLGFYCTVNKRKTTWTWKDEKKEGECYSLNISGNIEDIPTKLPRKKCSNLTVCSTKSTGAIKINDIGIGDYVGLEIDDNQRFVINDFTVTHNCANIYSKEFSIEITDSKRKKKYFQQFSNNMYTRKDPVITDIEDKGDAYIKTTFLPDYSRFGINKLTKDMYQIIKRRAYDIAATTNKKVKVYFNDEEIEVNNFRNYINMFYKNDDKQIYYKDFNERWSVGIVYDPDSQFDHMTFVNKINTFKGGTHLNHVVNQIVDKITDKIVSKDKKNNIKVKPSQIKDNITVFVNSTLEDPDFSSQSKEVLTTKSTKFKIKCDIDQKFIDDFCKNTKIVNDIFNISKARHENELGKTDGKKKASLNNISKLRDANFAGTDKSSKCVLILCEGDSALNTAIAGLEVIGNDYYGAMPLKGKLLNVKKSVTQKVLDNNEFAQLKQILGLKHGTAYNDVKSLRYGSVMVFTDADVDGYHIKGLFMNFIHTYWPSLLQVDGFIKSLATPIVKIFRASDTKKDNALETFFTQTEFNNWKKDIPENKLSTYYIKYYKGLGTSSTEEAREAFEDFENKLINYVWDPEQVESNKKKIQVENSSNNTEDNETETKSNISSTKGGGKKKSKYTIENKNKSDSSLIIAFADSFEDERKKLVKNYNKDVIIENSQKRVTYSEYVEKELVHFSHYNVMRSVPNISDGFKPSQRKILHGTFLRKLQTSETKVSQLSGYISDKTGYHHGEMSLQEAIIGMAQNFVGSNNINLLYPSGMFGTRIMGGKDHASSRYIFTKNAELLTSIFPSEDDPILEHIDEENEVVEPHVYYPIIPMILVNGSAGIGTGYSSTIPLYNPKDIINNVKIYLEKHERYDDQKLMTKFNNMIPWYRGFSGKIEKEDDYTYKTFGCYETLNENQVRITELPIGKWTSDYTDYLVSLISSNTLITDYKSNPSVYKVDFIITFKPNILQALIKSDTVHKELKLISTLKTSNMHLCKTVDNDNGTKTIKIHKYDNVNEIMIDYIKIRYEAYIKRKKYYTMVLENDMNILKYRKKFIEHLCSGKLVINKKKREEIVNSLVELGFPQLGIRIESDKSYDYLLNLPIFSLSEDRILEHEKNYQKKAEELELYKNTSIENLWTSDLDKFEKKYDKFYEEYIKKINTKCNNKMSSSKKKISKSSVTKKLTSKKSSK